MANTRIWIKAAHRELQINKRNKYIMGNKNMSMRCYANNSMLCRIREDLKGTYTEWMDAFSNRYQRWMNQKQMAAL